ncbi:hypothetical protein [Roseiterribacter gracilis]|uniref:Uncharacterized protein n=1 Tax=Roseiterribacter gracilis TaxID=2812848 RepID=A0A8S8X7E1_9PROT|nr:hypothetical protein TMPK1_13500 [Rhodospirillales bacterium TMPK1]
MERYATRRFWSRSGLALAGVLIGATAHAAPAPATAPAAAPAAAKAQGGEAGETGTGLSPELNSFSEALKKTFGGEGGESGAGVPDLRMSVTFPAMSEAEMKLALPGNSVVKPNNFYFHFADGGKLEGEAGGEKDLKGTWKIENGQLCMDWNSTKYKLGCHYLTLVVDEVLLFRPNGKPRLVAFIKKGRPA